ncbi:hypothetical protein vBEcoMphAPEC6_gp252c [Escherichia phage vB_EcoM_phAPEC6]|nr:hypothetical protein vBEcoMphAPEC6_gp252c [Escherichia phage vB_EcoM_phAPEC6]
MVHGKIFLNLIAGIQLTWIITGMNKRYHSQVVATMDVLQVYILFHLHYVILLVEFMY